MKRDGWQEKLVKPSQQVVKKHDSCSRDGWQEDRSSVLEVVDPSPASRVVQSSTARPVDIVASPCDPRLIALAALQSSLASFSFHLRVPVQSSSCGTRSIFNDKSASRRRRVPDRSSTCSARSSPCFSSIRQSSSSSARVALSIVRQSHRSSAFKK